MTLLWSNLPVNAILAAKCHKGGLPGNKSAAKDFVRSKFESGHTLKTTIILGSRLVSHFAPAVCGQVQERLQHSWAGMAHAPLLVTSS